MSDEFKRQIQEGLNALTRLRDEIRVELHLAGMDAKDKWAKIEPKFAQAETVAKSAGEAAQKVIKEAKEAFEEFRDTLRKQTGNKPS